jgi:hypothetical protein
MKRLRLSRTDSKDLGTADRTNTLRRGLAIFHCNFFRILDFPFCLALDTVSFNHVISSTRPSYRIGITMLRVPAFKEQNAQFSK